MQVVSFDKRPDANPDHVQGNILNFDALATAMQQVDVVFHLASVFGEPSTVFDNLNSVDVNIKGTVNVLEAAKIARVKRLFYPVKPTAASKSYSITKQAGEAFCSLFESLGFVELRRLFCLNTYGPGQQLQPEKTRVALHILETLEGLEPHAGEQTDPTQTEPTVELTFVDDLAKIIVAHTFNDDASGDVYSTGVTTEVAVSELNRRIKQLCNARISRYPSYPMQVAEQPQAFLPQCSTTSPKHGTRKNAAEVLGGIPVTAIDDGLSQTIAHYQSIGPNARQKALAGYHNIVAQRTQ